MTKKQAIKLFQERKVRTAWDDRVMTKDDDDIGAGCCCIFIIIVAILALVNEFDLTVWQAILSIACVICVPILLYVTYSSYRKEISKSLRLSFFYSPTILLLELCAEFGYIIYRDNVSITELFISTGIISIVITLLFLFCVSWSLSFWHKTVSMIIFGTISSIIISLITLYVFPSYMFIANDCMMPKHLHIEKYLTNITPLHWGKTYVVNTSDKTLYIYKTTCTYYKDKYNDNLVDIPFPQNAQFEKGVYFPEIFHLYEIPPRELSNQRIHYYVIDEDTYKVIREEESRKIVKCNHRHQYYYTQRVVHSRFRKYHED